MTSYPFSRRMRLLRAAEFDRVMQAKISTADGCLRVYGAANDLGYPRLGLVVSRRLGGAVQRNVWKRLLREAFRLVQHDLPAVDLACIPHRDVEPDMALLLNSFRKLAHRINEQLERRGRR